MTSVSEHSATHNTGSVISKAPATAAALYPAAAAASAAKAAMAAPSVPVVVCSRHCNRGCPLRISGAGARAWVTGLGLALGPGLGLGPEAGGGPFDPARWAGES